MGKLAGLKKALDMSKQARMQRARDMGFDTDTVYYHGTGADIEEFDPLKMGRTDDGWFGKGFYFSPDPNVANQYANTGQPNLMPVYLKSESPYDWRANEGRGMSLGTQEERYRKTKEILGAGHDSVDVFEELVRLPSDESLSQEAWQALTNHYKDKTGSHPSWLKKEVVEGTLRAGAPLQKYRELYGDEFVDNLPVDRMLKEKVVFNPNQIRSINAAFDPDKKDSANLLAGLGAGAVGIGGLLGSDEADASVAEIDAQIEQETNRERARRSRAFLHRRQAKKDQFSGLKAAIIAGLERMDYPAQFMQGQQALMQSLAQGEGIQGAISEGLRVGMQPLEQTAYERGDDVLDATGSEGLATTVNVLNQIASPF